MLARLVTVEDSHEKKRQFTELALLPSVFTEAYSAVLWDILLKVIIKKKKKMLAPWRKAMTNLDNILKSRDTTLLTKVCMYTQSYGFSDSSVWMWELDHKESWAPKNWCFRSIVVFVVLEKTLENPLDCKESKPVNSKGNQPWIFIESVAVKRKKKAEWVFLSSFPEKNIKRTVSRPSEKAMTPHSNTLAWKIPWMEEAGRLQSMG